MRRLSPRDRNEEDVERLAEYTHIIMDEVSNTVVSTVNIHFNG
jgi:hypothetical protein